MRYSKFVRICCFALAFLFAVSLVSCFGGNDDNGPDYDDPTRNPFGRYENTVKITGVMEYQVHNDSRVPQNMQENSESFAGTVNASPHRGQKPLKYSSLMKGTCFRIKSAPHNRQAGCAA